MPNYILAYHDGKTLPTKEEGARQMAAWKAWVASLGDAVVNPGTPLGKSRLVSSNGVSDDGGPNALNGFSVVKADSIEHAVKIAALCPYVELGTIEVAEMKQM